MHRMCLGKCFASKHIIYSVLVLVLDTRLLAKHSTAANNNLCVGNIGRSESRQRHMYLKITGKILREMRMRFFHGSSLNPVDGLQMRSSKNKSCSCRPSSVRMKTTKTKTTKRNVCRREFNVTAASVVWPRNFKTSAS